MSTSRRKRASTVAGIVLAASLLTGTVAATAAPSLGQDRATHDHATHDHATHDHSTIPLTEAPKDEPARGLIYGGLQPARSGPCTGGYQVMGVDFLMCTHGPDAPPAGLDVQRDVGLSAVAAEPQLQAVCEGDGVSGRRVEVLYIHGSTNNYDQVVGTLRSLAEQVDQIYLQSAQETGGERRVRYVTETVSGQCRPVVRDVGISDSALNANDWAPLLNAVRAAGYTRTDRKYLQFTESNVYCGIGGFAGDTTKGDSNQSNQGPEYARSDRGCWSAGVAAHELGHTLGAVNNNAPNASGYAHCVDEWDVMCYKDNADTVLRYECTDQAHDDLLDCNHDDYYHTNPAPGTYLDTYYNVADNLFLIKGTPSDPDPNLALQATPSCSYTSPWEDCEAINDGIDPPSSNDTVNPRWGTWPEQGQQWAELTWPDPVSADQAQVYIFDDNDGIDLPSSWTLQYWNGSAYVNVPGASGYPIVADQYNTVTFNSVSTTRLRVLVQSALDDSVGLLEVKVYGDSEPPPPPDENLALTASTSCSYTSPWEACAAINTGGDPASSNIPGPDQGTRWGTWPEDGQQWAQLTWSSAQGLSRAEVYFFDDGQGIDLPSSWTLQYWNGSAYVNVSGASGYPIAADQYNVVTFDQVNTERLRVALTGSGTDSVGLLEVKAFAG